MTLVLLDVDGVVNALAGRGSGWRTGTAVADSRSWDIRWSPRVVDAVRGWCERADVRWLTTWGHDANISLRHLVGLPELPVAGTYDDVDASGAPDRAGAALASVTPAAPDPLTGQWWKFDVVRGLVRAEPGRRLVWLDDDLALDPGVRDWMQAHADCLLIAPDPRSGLSADELARVEAFLS